MRTINEFMPEFDEEERFWLAKEIKRHRKNGQRAMARRLYQSHKALCQKMDELYWVQRQVEQIFNTVH